MQFHDYCEHNNTIYILSFCFRFVIHLWREEKKNGWRITITIVGVAWARNNQINNNVYRKYKYQILNGDQI